MDKVISTTLKVIGVLLVVFALYFLRDVIFYFLFAFLIAAALRPSVDYFEKRKIPRAVSTVSIFLLFLIVILLIFTLTIPLLIQESQTFFNNLPDYLENLIDSFSRLERTESGLYLLKNIESAISNIFQNIPQSIMSIVGTIPKFFGSLHNVIFVLVVAFYLTMKKDIIEKFSTFLFSENKELEKKFLRNWKRAEQLAGRWLQGYLISGITVAILVYIGLSIFGVKYKLLLAFLAGILEIIPLFGPLIAGIIGVFFTLIYAGFPKAILVAIVFLAVQVIENYLITPLVMRNRIYLHPVLVIIILFIGTKVVGILGTIFFIPFFAILLTILKDHYPDYIFWKRDKNLKEIE